MSTVEAHRSQNDTLALNMRTALPRPWSRDFTLILLIKCINYLVVCKLRIVYVLFICSAFPECFFCV